MKFLSQLLKSRTVIVNALTVIAAGIAAVHGHDVMAAHPEVVAALGAALGVVNVVLRVLTVEPISEK